MLSVNQRLPSEPLVMFLGWLSAVGTLNCLNLPTGAAWAAESVAPSTMASAATSANTSANRRTADGRWCVESFLLGSHSYASLLS